METSQDYQINLEVFQGPLDLLLFLIKKKKIDIHDIPIASITKEYLQYLNNKKNINLERESEFLLMAALLIHIKSRLLLPRETLEEEPDPREILVERLLDYKNIKAACEILREKEEKQTKKWKRSALPKSVPFKEFDFMEISLFEVAEVFFNLMKKQQKSHMKVITGKEFSVKEKKQEIINHLKNNVYLDFATYFNNQKTIEEAMVSFFCLLELISEKIVIAVQEKLFYTIKVWLRNEVDS